MIITGILQIFILFGQETHEVMILANKTSETVTVLASSNMVHTHSSPKDYLEVIHVMLKPFKSDSRNTVLLLEPWGCCSQAVRPTSSPGLASFAHPFCAAPLQLIPHTACSQQECSALAGTLKMDYDLVSQEGF